MLGIFVVALSFIIFIFQKLSVRKYGSQPNRRKLTGCEMARHLLDTCGFSQVAVESLPQHSPQSSNMKQLFLQPEVYEGTSLLALVHAAKESVKLSRTRSSAVSAVLKKYIHFMFRVVIFAGWIFMILGAVASDFRSLIKIAFDIFIIVFIWAVVNLPEQWEISEQAFLMLKQSGYFELDELVRVKKILRIQRFDQLAWIFGVRDAA